MNDVPVVEGDSTRMKEDSSYTFALSDFNKNYSDVEDGNSLSSVKLTTLPGDGTLKQ